VSLSDAAGRGGSASRSDPTRPDHRFPRSCRLTSRRQFISVYEKGRRVSSSSFVLFGLPNTCGECRLGITVTRKIGNAVRRNRIKRVLRDIFRRHRAELGPPIDVVVNARPPIVGAESAALEVEFLKTFARLARRVAG